MHLPILDEIPASRKTVDAFYGYNHNLRIGDGEFYDMENLTSSYFPVLSPRGRRGVYVTTPNIQGLIAKDNLCYVADGKFYLNGDVIEGFDLDPQGEKQMVSMGAYICIFPDNKYINTLNTTEYGNMGNEQISTSAVTFSICKADGGDMTTSTTKPDDPEDGELWIDTSVTPNALKQWSDTNSMWVQLATTYVKISSPGIGAGFKQYDGVKISGLKGVSLIDHFTGSVRPNESISAIDGNFVIQNCGDDYIIIIGIIDTVRTIDNQITIRREIPDLDFVVECGNRLWGCKYGDITDADGNVSIVNEIYASKLGDFKNWNCFMGLSTDSYAASCGTDGAFTGAINYQGHPLFFKEECLHKVYGNYPANYQVTDMACRGVQKGCSKSLAMVNEVLYYKSKSSICAYDGSLPAEISSAFGDVRYSDAVAGAHGNKYYVSLKDNSGHYHLFVYDASKRMWHREDNTHATAFCWCNNELYYAEDGAIKTMFGSHEQDTKPVKWMAESGIIGVTMPDKKYLSRLNVRMSLDMGARVYFYIQYDSMGAWEHIATMTGRNLRSFNVPIRPRRCDHMRLRIVGEGDAKIFSITKTIEQGSDV
jgi:hypothetical protein